MRGLITLTTDFGTSDWYVASMKGVILSRHPCCTIVDITHEIPPGELFQAAWVLRQALPWFPLGTVHLVVVDPGVGTSRAAMAARAGGFFFVGPDNGVLSLALELYPEVELRRIESKDVMLQPPSATFHGRDIFAPAAAHLASGGRLDSLGPEMKSWVRLEQPPLSFGEGFIEGRIVYMDRFGNGVTNIAEKALSEICYKGKFRIMVGESLVLDSMNKTYGEALPGEPLALIGSSGFLEIAVRGASAKERLGLKAGETKVVVQGVK